MKNTAIKGKENEATLPKKSAVEPVSDVLTENQQLMLKVKVICTVINTANC
jgi:hypothetical protein